MPNGSISCSSAAMPLYNLMILRFFFQSRSHFCSDSFLANFCHDISLFIKNDPLNEWFKCLNVHDGDDDTMMMRYPNEPVTYQCALRCFESTIAEQ
jgi:hypothetical protein